MWRRAREAGGRIKPGAQAPGRYGSTLNAPEPAKAGDSAAARFAGSNRHFNELTWGLRPRLYSCAEHVRQLGGESPLLNLMEVKS